MMNNPPEWHRQHGETEPAYAAFARYLELGSERSIEAVRHPHGNYPGKNGRLLEMWSSRNRWVERARAFDNHVIAIEQAAREKARAEFTEKWERRRLQAAAGNWQTAKKLRKKVEEMLASPLANTKWNMSSAATAAKIAAELEAIAISAATGGDDDAFDPSTATAEECREYLAQQGVKFVARRKQTGPVD